VLYIPVFIPDIVLASVLGTLVGGKLYYVAVITKDSKDPAAVQKLLEQNLQHPALFEDEEEFNRAG
jgi:hypothetical protein